MNPEINFLFSSDYNGDMLNHSDQSNIPSYSSHSNSYSCSSNSLKANVNNINVNAKVILINDILCHCFKIKIFRSMEVVI